MDIIIENLIIENQTFESLLENINIQNPNIKTLTIKNLTIKNSIEEQIIKEDSNNGSDNGLIEELDKIDIKETKKDNKTIINEVITFEGKNIRVYGTTENPWFRGKDVSIILGYPSNNTQKIIKNSVSESNKKLLSDIINDIGNISTNFSFNE